jgi:hypothetical protein
MTDLKDGRTALSATRSAEVMKGGPSMKEFAGKIKARLEAVLFKTRGYFFTLGTDTHTASGRQKRVKRKK